mmetsp:Transcript_14109/g.40349  ORF Transcript_14109/g.40349 Transcript_14109/m.40349 type:complete len:203 (-) Transcript_14109:353-961(-)
MHHLVLPVPDKSLVRPWYVLARDKHVRLKAFLVPNSVRVGGGQPFAEIRRPMSRFVPVRVEWLDAAVPEHHRGRVLPAQHRLPRHLHSDIPRVSSLVCREHDCLSAIHRLEQRLVLGRRLHELGKLRRRPEVHVQQENNVGPGVGNGPIPHRVDGIEGAEPHALDRLTHELDVEFAHALGLRHPVELLKLLPDVLHGRQMRV